MTLHTVLTVLLAAYLAPGVVLAVAGYRQHTADIHGAYTVLAAARGRVHAAAAVGWGAVIAVLTWPRNLRSIGRCCDWCGIRIAGARRWWATGCRSCAPHLQLTAEHCPPHPHGSRAGKVETPIGVHR